MEIGYYGSIWSKGYMVPWLHNIHATSVHTEMDSQWLLHNRGISMAWEVTKIPASIALKD